MFSAQFTILFFLFLSVVFWIFFLLQTGIFLLYFIFFLNEHGLNLEMQVQCMSDYFLRG